MIGNDVVDLAHRGTQPGAQHPRFDARVFTERERAELASAGARASLRWIYWAAKEAAYKVAKKLDASVVWAPSRFDVTLSVSPGSDPGETFGSDPKVSLGRVQHGGRSFELRAFVTGDYVHALADDGSAGPAAQHAAVSAPASEADDASARARAFACAELAPALGVPPAALGIVKRGRVPVLCVDGAPARADLSLSHHGRFVAYACELGASAPAARLAS